ncbi:MAG: hypothetical protein GF398_09330 [Chitinivibrionales bacterium]|nr:hypothetical protein [Chitinivibrionales bacterium]
MTWTELDDILKSKQSFLLSSHVSLDGDCVGTQLAVYWYLNSIGKEVVIYNHDPLPHKFAFLKNADVLDTKHPQRRFDVFCILDCSNPNRLGWKEHDAIADTTINIDHHRDNTHFADHNIVDEKVAATAELIYGFFVSESIDFPDYVAAALYTAIMTDTGGFRFSNTNATVLRICADLADRGADCATIYQHAYDSHSSNGLLLWAKIWSTTRFYLNNQVCSMELPLSLIDEIGATYSDSEGIADRTVLARGVAVGMFIKHKKNETHFSLRSREVLDVGKIAQKIPGGGGHASAAGCTIYKPLEEARREMLDIIAKELQSD